ncbi:MAG: exodeoxyribonuclease VII small subunit [Anaerolineales bacterium]
MSETIITEALSYEAAFQQLQEIVQTLEGDACSLEQSLALFERGQTLAKYCATLLDAAELQVQQVTDEERG